MTQGINSYEILPKEFTTFNFKFSGSITAERFKCPDGYLDIIRNGSFCYTNLLAGTDYPSAKEDCEKRKGSLIQINNEFEHTTLYKKYLADADAGSKHPEFWIDLKWENGTTFTCCILSKVSNQSLFFNPMMTLPQVCISGVLEILSPTIMI